MARLPFGIVCLNCCCPTERRTKTVAYRVYILFFTFIIYTTYHLSRKPISVVKSVLHSCSNGTINATSYGVRCHGWAPFDQKNYLELLGSLDYAFLFAYAVGMFISGHVAERMNLRHFLSLGMLLSGTFVALFGFGRYWQIHSLTYYLAIQVFAGLFQASGWPSVVTTVANWFGKGKRGFIMGVWNSHTSVGNILGSLIAGAFVQYNWGLSFIIPGLIILACGFLTSLILVPHPADVDCELPDHQNRERIESNDEVDALMPVQASNEQSTEQQAITFAAALRIPGVIEFSLCLFFAKLVSYTFLFWLPNYIKNTTPYTVEQAADLSTLFDFGGIAGGILAGAVSDFTGGRATTCMVMLAMAAPALFIYQTFGHLSLQWNIFMLLLCGGLVNGPYALITTAVSADLGTHRSLHGNAKALATVTAIIDGTGSMGAALGPLLTGLISPTGWSNVFYMLIAADVAALLLLSRVVLKEVLMWVRRQPATL